jgi:hypothetical protein
MSLFKSNRVQVLETKVEALSSSLERLRTQHYELSASHDRLLAYLKLYEHKEPAKTELRKGKPPAPTYASYQNMANHAQFWRIL